MHTNFYQNPSTFAEVMHKSTLVLFMPHSVVAGESIPVKPNLSVLFQIIQLLAAFSSDKIYRRNVSEEHT